MPKSLLFPAELRQFQIAGMQLEFSAQRATMLEQSHWTERVGRRPEPRRQGSRDIWLSLADGRSPLLRIQNDCEFPIYHHQRLSLVCVSALELGRQECYAALYNHGNNRWVIFEQQALLQALRQHELHARPLVWRLLLKLTLGLGSKLLELRKEGRHQRNQRLLQQRLSRIVRWCSLH